MDIKEILSILLISAFFVGIVFSSGCTVPGKTDKIINTNTIYVGGTQGLEMSFPAGRPPSKIYGDSTFNVALKLKNSGETTVNNGGAILYLEGINPTNFGLSSTSKSLSNNLNGVQKIGDSVIPGGISEISFDNLEYQGTSIPVGGEWSQTIHARLCYNYETRATSTVCLKSNIYTETIGNSACKVAGDKKVESSGAPIQVVSIEEIPEGNTRVGFRIKIANVGGGIPYLGSLSSCNSLDSSSKDKIKLSSKSCDSLSSLKCTSGCTGNNNDEIYVYDGQATIFLEGDINSGSPSTEYEDLLKLKFDYNYMKESSKKITLVGTGSAS